MRPARFSFFAATALVVVACSASEGGGVQPFVPDPNAPSETTPGEEPDVPHALGTIVLGEAHAAGRSESSPIVSISFVPDAATAKSCTEELAGCKITLAPKCTSCNTGEACVLDDTCKAVCQKIVSCTKECTNDELCNTKTGKCEARPAFDAGPIAFSGTTTPITLYPPYAFQGDAKGAPFLGGVDLRVKAQGAATRGFEAFDETFKATTFIQATPSLDRIKREAVFGKGPLTVAWVPGADDIVVTVGGAAGAATCKAIDANGKFDVPRAVVDRVRGTGPASGTVTLGLSRQRVETKKDKRAKGGPDVQPVGWLALTTTSFESTSFQGCTAGQTACGDDCVDTATDPRNCGACGAVCTGSCSAGKCQTGCAPGPENTLAKCSDGCSNDGDAYIDCNDFDCCPVRSDCPATTACGKQR